MDILYFAWLRERIGEPKEKIDTRAATVAQLIEELRSRSEAHALAFADTSAIRAAVDQELVPMETSLDGVREVAFFPPMTGG